MNPNERPRYSVELRGGTATLTVEAPDWAGLVTTALLAGSDLVVPVGTFQTWTARRLSARGETAGETLHAVLVSALADWTEGGFLTALVEPDVTDPRRVTAILRGGRVDPDDPRPSVDPVGLVAGATSVEVGGGDAPWRARFALRLAPAPESGPA